ncbi:unnamed protein product, partial [Adineta ricciae]
HDVDDFADRIFDYLDETCTKTALHPVENNQINSSPSTTLYQSTSLVQKASDQEITKSFVCAFCPYSTPNILEFQTHVAKHTEKNFRCLLCNCMYKYRRDCVTHMKRKHSSTVTGSISQYIQKMSNPTSINNTVTNPPSTEPKRYGCPYCSLMTRSTSSIYKHQSRKHALLPKVVHKYSTEDSNSRNLIAILEQKSVKKSPAPILDNKSPSTAQSVNIVPTSTDIGKFSPASSSSSSVVEQYVESFSVNDSEQYPNSKYMTTHNIYSSNGELSKVFQCYLCNYRAQHPSNVIRHLKAVHSFNYDPSNEFNNQSEDSTDRLMIDYDEDKVDSHSEEKPICSLNTVVQAPVVVRQIKPDCDSAKPFADIHLSVNIYLPKRKKSIQVDRVASNCSNTDYSNADDDRNNDDQDEKVKVQVSTSTTPTVVTGGSLYKPHKCRRCFYRSNWKTDMLHHIRLKHQISHVTKHDYISMDAQSALQTFSNYENTFGKALKNRLLLSKIDYVDCSWEQLKLKLFNSNDDKKLIHHDCLSSQSSSSSSSAAATAAISFAHDTSSALNNDQTNHFI